MRHYVVDALHTAHTFRVASWPTIGGVGIAAGAADHAGTVYFVDDNGWVASCGPHHCKRFWPTAIKFRKNLPSVRKSSHDRIGSLAATPSGVLWMVTVGYSLSRVLRLSGPEGWETVLETEHAWNHWPVHLAVHYLPADERVVLSTAEGLIFLDDVMPLEPALSLGEEKALAFSGSSFSNLYMATNGGHLYHFDGEVSRRVWSHPLQLSLRSLDVHRGQAVCVDGSGDVWLGSVVEGDLRCVGGGQYMYGSSVRHPLSFIGGRCVAVARREAALSPSLEGEQPASRDWRSLKESPSRSFVTRKSVV